jgi:hypothetical protein
MVGGPSGASLEEKQEHVQGAGALWKACLIGLGAEIVMIEDES